MVKHENRKVPDNSDSGAGKEIATDLDDTTLVSARATEQNNDSAAGFSDVGLVRQLNEDNWHWEKLTGDLVLYAVADGMGGHDRGEVASQLAVDTLFAAAHEGVSELREMDVSTLRRVLRRSVQTANQKVVTTGIEQESNMGTTLCAALMDSANNAIIANVGDSRVYILRDGELNQVSHDHSLVAYLVRLGELSPEEARDHPSGNILVRSIGSVPHVEVDMFHVEVQEGDRLMLCSDGLWGEVTDDQLRTVMLENRDPSQACHALVEMANDHGGRDNTTLIVVNV